MQTNILNFQCGLFKPLKAFLCNLPKDFLKKNLQSQMHTSYLSGAPGAVPVEKKLSCGEICSHDRLSGGEILHMRNVKKIGNVNK